MAEGTDQWRNGIKKRVTKVADVSSHLHSSCSDCSPTVLPVFTDITLTDSSHVQAFGTCLTVQCRLVLCSNFQAGDHAVCLMMPLLLLPCQQQKWPWL